MIFMFEKNQHINFTTSQAKYGGQPRNFTESLDTAGTHEGAMSRYDVSPVVGTIQRRWMLGDKFKNVNFSDVVCMSLQEYPTQLNYVISVGVNHSPEDWTGSPITDSKYETRRSLFEDLNPKYLKDLQDNNALLLIDQTHEGYTHENLFAWFYDNAANFGICPSRIIYTTGDLNSYATHLKFADDLHLPSEARMFVQPYAAFQWMIHANYTNEIYNRRAEKHTFADHVRYKTTNIDDIKVYNLLQKRPRGHRSWTWKSFFDRDLIDHGIVSTNRPENRHNFHFDDSPEISQTEFDVLCADLPKMHGYDKPELTGDFTSSTGGDFIQRINPEVMRHSFVSVISEAMFGDKESRGQCFLSEKTFKPIVGHHPFIIIGNKGSIAHIKSMGYKTFDKWWDEGYDNLPTWERLAAITDIVFALTQMSKQQLLDMYIEMQPVLEHNYKTLFSNCENMFGPQAVNIVQYLRSKGASDA